MLSLSSLLSSNQHSSLSCWTKKIYTYRTRMKTKKVDISPVSLWSSLGSSFGTVKDTNSPEVLVRIPLRFDMHRFVVTRGVCTDTASSEVLVQILFCRRCLYGFRFASTFDDPGKKKRKKTATGMEQQNDKPGMMRRNYVRERMVQESISLQQ